MNLDLVPEHLPVIAARLGISAADLMQMLSSAVPAALPLQPGLDDVSAMIPQAFAKHAQLFFPSTTDGVAGEPRARPRCPTSALPTSFLISTAASRFTPPE